MTPPKTIGLFTEQAFEESAIEYFSKYSPGPVYIIPTETVDGPGLFVCDEPFTIEEAEEQHSFVPDEASLEMLSEDSDDDIDDFPTTSEDE